MPAGMVAFRVADLQIGFILSYGWAFHSPAPHGIPLAVVAPAPESGPLVARLNLIPSAPLHATAAPSQAAARRLIRDDAVSAALVINPAARTDTLLIASAGGSSEASAAEQVITAAESRQNMRIIDWSLRRSAQRVPPVPVHPLRQVRVHRVPDPDAVARYRPPRLVTRS